MSVTGAHGQKEAWSEACTRLFRPGGGEDVLARPHLPERRSLLARGPVRPSPDRSLQPSGDLTAVSSYSDPKRVPLKSQKGASSTGTPVRLSRGLSRRIRCAS